MNAWLRGPLKDVFQEFVMQQKEILGMPVNHAKLGPMFQQHVDSQADEARSLWTLLSLALWERKHYRGRFHQPSELLLQRTSTSVVPSATVATT
jgi:hypothetical protein